MVSKPIETFLSFLHDVEQQYRMAEADEQEANAETQDLLHRLELESHTYHEFAKLSKQLQSTRQKRRKAKDAMAECLPVCQWLEANRATVKGLEKLLGEVRRAERATEGPRVYTPRIRKKD